MFQVNKQNAVLYEYKEQFRKLKNILLLIKYIQKCINKLLFMRTNILNNKINVCSRIIYIKVCKL